MDVSSLMQRNVATARATDRLDVAASHLRDRDCGSVVVVVERRCPVGVPTDRDICLAALRFMRPRLVDGDQAGAGG